MRLPISGFYHEVGPDHLGNHRRRFEQYGQVFTTDHGKCRTTYYTNDPKVAEICFANGCLYSKKINNDRPLFGLKDLIATLFL
jgi:hypothetical protein